MQDGWMMSCPRRCTKREPGIFWTWNSELKHFWNSHPRTWGNDSQFDNHIFQMGWFPTSWVIIAKGPFQIGSTFTPSKTNVTIEKHLDWRCKDGDFQLFFYMQKMVIFHCLPIKHCYFPLLSYSKWDFPASHDSFRVSLCILLLVTCISPRWSTNGAKAGLLVCSRGSCQPIVLVASSHLVSG